MRLFGYPYNNDLVICKDSLDYLYILLKKIENVKNNLHYTVYTLVALIPGEIFENILQLKRFGLNFERTLNRKWLLSYSLIKVPLFIIKK